MPERPNMLYIFENKIVQEYQKWYLLSLAQLYKVLSFLLLQPIRYLSTSLHIFIYFLITWSRAPSRCPRTCRWCRRARSTWRRWDRTRSGNVLCARRCRGQPAPQFIRLSIPTHISTQCCYLMRLDTTAVEQCIWTLHFWSVVNPNSVQRWSVISWWWIEKK